MSGADRELGAGEEDEIERCAQTLLPPPEQEFPPEETLRSAWMQVRRLTFPQFAEFARSLQELAYPQISWLDSTGEWMGVSATDVPWDSIVSDLQPAPGDHVGLSVTFRGSFVRSQSVYRVVVAGVDAVVGDAFTLDGFDSFRVVRPFSSPGKLAVPITVFVVQDGVLVRASKSVELTLQSDPHEVSRLRNAVAKLAASGPAERKLWYLTLRRAQSRAIAPDLLALAQTNADPSVCEDALSLLSYVGAYEHVGALAGMLDASEHAAVESYVVRALVRLTGYRTSMRGSPRLEIQEALALGRDGWREWIATHQQQIRLRLDDPK